jgi:phage recombination protein Bet
MTKQTAVAEKASGEPVIYQGFTKSDIDLIRATIAPDLTREELGLYLYTAHQRGLSPLAGQIYAVKRKGRVALQTSIDGYRLIAERTGKYAGQLGPFWCGEDGKWVDVWLSSDPPKAAKVGILRHDFKEPLWSVATWDSYAQKTGVWPTHGPLMLAKCAESLGLRRGFPQELSGLYTSEEMGQADNGAEVPPPPPSMEVPAGGLADVSPAKGEPGSDPEGGKGAPEGEDPGEPENGPCGPPQALWKRLEEAFGKTPPWEEPRKKAVLKAIFGTSSVRLIKTRDAANVAAAMARLEEAIGQVQAQADKEAADA